MQERPMSKSEKSPCQSLVKMNVRRLRTLKGLSQHELSVESGMTRAYLGRIESRGQNITLNTLCALADALDVDPRELLRPAEDWD
jgi:transcriptional regulator with XRE-family HTH domain